MSSARLKDDKRFNVVIDKIVTNLLFLEFNETHSPFDNPEVRRAISYAIDRDAAVKAAFDGYAAPALSPLAIGIPGYRTPAPRRRTH